MPYVYDHEKSMEAGAFGPLPACALERLNRIRRIGVSSDGRQLVQDRLIHGWQCGPNGEISPFATLAVEEAIGHPAEYHDDERR